MKKPAKNSKKYEEISRRCALCTAKFEIWLNNSKLSDEKREKMSERLLSHCPMCAKLGEG